MPQFRLSNLSAHQRKCIRRMYESEVSGVTDGLYGNHDFYQQEGNHSSFLFDRRHPGLGSVNKATARALCRNGAIADTGRYYAMSQVCKDALRADAQPGKFPKLRKLLLKGPCRSIFDSILRLFADWDDTSEREVAFDYAQAHLASWPDKYRMIGTRELNHFFSHVHPLCRAIDLSADGRHQISSKNCETMLYGEGLSKVSVLVGCGNQMTRAIAASITRSSFAESLKDVAFYRVLDLSSAAGCFSRLFVEPSSRLPNIERLRVQECRVPISELRELGDHFGGPYGLNDLREFDIRGNRCSSDDLLFLAECFQANKINSQFEQLVADYGVLGDEQRKAAEKAFGIRIAAEGEFGE